MKRYIAFLFDHPEHNIHSGGWEDVLGFVSGSACSFTTVEEAQSVVKATIGSDNPREYRGHVVDLHTGCIVLSF